MFRLLIDACEVRPDGIGGCDCGKGYEGDGALDDSYSVSCVEAAELGGREKSAEGSGRGIVDDDADTDALFVFLQSFLILFIDTSVVRLLVAFRLALAFAAASSSTESAENRLEGVFDGGRSYGSALSGNP